MKITTLFITIAILQVSAATLAQQVTLKEKQVGLDQLFKDIRKQTGYDFFYDAALVEKAGLVSIDVKDVPLEVALNSIIKDPLVFTIADKTVIVKEKEPGLIEKAKAFFEQVTVRGRVQDETGAALPGVTVRQKNTNNATVTGIDGSYNLTVTDNSIIITFSYIGYETQELKAKDIPDASVIKLKAAATNLQEVVVSKGYYDTRRALNTGNVAVVTSKEIEEQPVSDPIMALEGRVAGLDIQQSSGMPGANETIRIRGQNSINNGNDPLYIIDGVPFSSTSLTSAIGGGALGGNSGTNNLSINREGNFGMSHFQALNPADIENITILKDADATAIYGSRGANGVILITTKKGKAGDTRINLDLSQGIGKVTRMMDLLNTPQYLEMRNEALKNDGLTPSLANGDYDLLLWDTTRYTNWQKALIGNTAHYTNAQLSISGGNANTQFLLSGGYNQQGTVFPGDYGDTKGSAHVSINHNSDDQRFHVVFSASYVNDNSNLPSSDFTNDIPGLAPDSPPLYNANGSLNWAPYNGSATFYNPLAPTVIHADAATNNLISNLNFDYEVLPGLKISSNFGYTRDEMNQNILTPATTYPPPNNTNPSERSNFFATTTFSTWSIEPQLTYRKKIGKGQFDALLGTTFQQSTQNSLSQAAKNFSSDALISDPLAATTNFLIAETANLYKYNALYGRLGYNWDEKYLLNITARRDGSSRFGPGRQFGNFGAVGAGWIFSKEKLVEDALPWLSFGKLRGSYGITGNDQTGDYQFLSTYSINSTSYQGYTGLSPTQLSNANLAWEQVKKTEIGLELGFLKDRINFTASYFYDRSSNQLVGYPLPTITGFSSIPAYNLPAVIQNTGTELTINTVNIKSTNFKWTSAATLTVPSNKLISFPDLASSGFQYLYAVGSSLYIQYLYHYTGVNPQTGVYDFASQNGTGSPSYPQDQSISKPVTQLYYGGIQNSFSYKGFQLDVFIQYVRQNSYNYLNSFVLFPGLAGNEQPTVVLQRWQNPGDAVNIEKFTSSFGGAAGQAYYNFFTHSDAIITDGSFIRLKNVAFSYTLPNSWQKKAHLQDTRIFLQGQNLLTITHYLGLDPETGGLNLPPLRMITLGIHTSL